MIRGAIDKVYTAITLRVKGFVDMLQGLLNRIKFEFEKLKLKAQGIIAKLKDSSVISLAFDLLREIYTVVTRYKGRMGETVKGMVTKAKTLAKEFVKKGENMVRDIATRAR